MTKNATPEDVIKAVSTQILPLLNEKQKRLTAGCMANAYGRGGTAVVERYSGMARNTISKGKKEIAEESASSLNEEKVETKAKQKSSNEKIRKEGAGRRRETDKHPEIKDYIIGRVQESTYGDPESLLLYTSLSQRDLARSVKEDLGFNISHNIVGNILEEADYSKQRNKKLQQVYGTKVDPNVRDEQFKHINETAKKYVKEGLPVISIDCKKKEVLGNLANNGQEYRKKKDPRAVNDHDFESKDLGKIAPYGVWVMNDNTAFVNLGVSNDTAEFAAMSVRTWWYDIGIHTFPNAKKIYITADGGGSNGSRCRLWKLELAKLAEETHLEIEVSHFPPGTSKWNKVEHRLFSYITKSWSGKPLIDVQTAVKLIGSTTTEKGLKVICKEDPRSYEVGIRVTDEQMESIDIEYPDTSNKWNYIVRGFKDPADIVIKPKRGRGRPKKNL